MKGSATLWMGTAVITRMSVSVLAVSAPAEHQRVHDGAEHADVVRLGAADAPSFGHPAAEVVSAADHHRHLHAEIVHGENFLGDAGQAGRIYPGATPSGECLAA